MTTNKQLAAKAGIGSALDQFQPLSKYEDDFHRPDHLGCISAGYKDDRGLPVVSRNHVIHLHDPEGRAQGLAAILAKSGGKRLTVAMPSNDPDDFIHQSFRKDSKTMLQAFGDKHGITTIDPIAGSNPPTAKRTYHPAGTPTFDRLVLECKVSTNITFILADYDAQGRPIYPFVDGLGTYRMRTTSTRTVDNLLDQLKTIAKFSGGPIAGFPLDVQLVNRNVTGPDGSKRQVPLFVFTLRPPATIVLDNQTLKAIAVAACEAIGTCMPALPAPESIDDAIEEFDQLTAKEVHALTTGLDEALIRRTFFAITKDTWADKDESRRAFMSYYTNGETESLATFLATTTPETADAMLEDLRGYVEDMAPVPAADEDGVIDVVGQVVDEEPEAMATEAEGQELWRILSETWPDEAKVILRECLAGFKVARIGELTAVQVQHTIRHYAASAKAVA